MPDTISATRTETGGITLEARDLGEAEVRVWVAETLLDAVTLRTAPAAKARSELVYKTSIPGDVLLLQVNEVRGDCGKRRCRLTGWDFMQWRAVPEGGAAQILQSPFFSSRWIWFEVDADIWEHTDVRTLTLSGVDRHSGRELLTYDIEIFGVEGDAELASLPPRP